MTQKAYAEGLRALYMYAAAHQNDDVAQHVSGADPDLAHRVDDLLLPVVKGVGSERAYEILTESLQTLGGSGFLQDYPIEQYIRDAKIDSLYEGTTAIQALDFIFRKIFRDNGAALAHVASQISKTIEGCDAALKTQADQLRVRARRRPGDDGRADRLPDGRVRTAHGDLQDRSVVGAFPARRRGPDHRLAAAGAGRRGARGARRPDRRADDEAFYQGKIATAAFFAVEHAAETSRRRARHRRDHRRRHHARCPRRRSKCARYCVSVKLSHAGHGRRVGFAEAVQIG